MTFCVVRVSLTFKKKAAELPGCFIIKLKPSLYSKTAIHSLEIMLAEDTHQLNESFS